jgi:hypothetical protein
MKKTMFYFGHQDFEALEDLELDGTTVSVLGLRSWKLSNVGRSSDEPNICYLELLRASEGTYGRWSQLHLQSLTKIRTGPALWVRARSPYV